ncbi:MAG: tRNA pseudouridine(55) synthase TruB [Candidatus Spyradosoma sp.]
MIEYNGVLLIDKPSGWTSHDVVAKLRGILRTRRVGHAGTLDPLATGLLVVLVGNACKASQYLMSQGKIYEGAFRLGRVTNTQDSDGEIMEENPVPADITPEKIAEAMRSMLGDQYQTPPMFSAIKINGQPLYKMARKGQETEREPRFIRISSFELLGADLPEARFRVECTKGTYVRTLAHDLGRRLGPGATLTALRRIASGDHDVADAVTLEALQAMTPEEIAKRLIDVRSCVPSHAL